MNIGNNRAGERRSTQPVTIGEHLDKSCVLIGDGLHSRGFETEVEEYLLKAGFTFDDRGYETLLEIDRESHSIRDPFFFRKDSQTDFNQPTERKRR